MLANLGETVATYVSQRPERVAVSVTAIDSELLRPASDRLSDGTTSSQPALELAIAVGKGRTRGGAHVEHSALAGELAKLDGTHYLAWRQRTAGGRVASDQDACLAYAFVLRSDQTRALGIGGPEAVDDRFGPAACRIGAAALLCTVTEDFHPEARALFLLRPGVETRTPEWWESIGVTVLAQRPYDPNAAAAIGTVGDIQAAISRSYGLEELPFE